MSSLGKIVAAHPLSKFTPYNAIKFAHIDHMGTPLYTVGKDKKAVGAAAAVRAAFEKHGGHCFHCKDFMPPQPLSHDCTRDHLRPKSDGGQDYLHNLVFSCGACNRKKGRRDLISFNAETGIEYMKALDEHIVRCVNQLSLISAKR